MPILNIPQGGGTASFLVSEARGYRSREQGVVATGSGKLPAGMLMGRTADTGQFVPYAAGGANGAGSVAGILFEAVDATNAPVKVTLVVGDAEVQRSQLAFAGTPDAAAKNAAYAALAVLGIRLR